jgi:hypothetical protein
MSPPLFYQLARTIEAAPAQQRRALLAALDGFDPSHSSTRAVVEAIEEGLSEEIATRCTTEGE